MSLLVALFQVCERCFLSVSVIAFQSFSSRRILWYLQESVHIPDEERVLLVLYKGTFTNVSLVNIISKTKVFCYVPEVQFSR